MPGPLDLARGWFAKGDNDRANARLVLQANGPFDTACFHTQQAAEKYLKALLAAGGFPIPRTHDLEEIYRACLDRGIAIVLDPARLAILTPYAVELRYDPEFAPDVDRTRRALEIREEVRSAAGPRLPPPTPPPPPPAPPTSPVPPPATP